MQQDMDRLFAEQKELAVAIRMAMGKAMVDVMAENDVQDSRDKFLIMGMALGDMISAWIYTIADTPEGRKGAHKLFDDMVKALVKAKENQGGSRAPTEH